LCFADDLMIFYWAEVGIVSLIENYVDQFQLFFGLSPNHDKNSMFLYGVNPNARMRLLDVIDYKGSCWSSTLVFPLLLQNSHFLIVWSWWIVLWIRPVGWITLSHIRVDFNLLNPFSFVFRWSSLFIILKAIIVKITSLLWCFLWNGSDLASSGAKVAWDKICLPKKEGGLCMKNQRVWDICTRPAHSI
jgi:hypothetical protein